MLFVAYRKSEKSGKEELFSFCADGEEGHHVIYRNKGEDGRRKKKV